MVSLYYRGLYSVVALIVYLAKGSFGYIDVHSTRLSCVDTATDCMMHCGIGIGIVSIGVVSIGILSRAVLSVGVLIVQASVSYTVPNSMGVLIVLRAWWYRGPYSIGCLVV